MMNFQFTLKEIIQFLEKENISFEVRIGKGKFESEKFSLASTRNKIEFGIYFLDSSQHSQSGTIHNSIILTDQFDTKEGSNALIVVDDPQLTHYKLALSREEKIGAFIHPTAIIHKDAKISVSAHIGPYCVIGKCKIGEGVVLTGSVTVNDGSEIRSNTIIESQTVIGARGMAWIWDENGGRLMQPQIGGVIIEEDCIIGSGISIVRGSLSENTIIGRGTVMAHGTRIGHGSVVGKLVHFANNVSLAGNTNIADRVFLGSGSVVSSNVSISEGCIVGAGAVVHRSVEEKNCTLAGVPAVIVKRNNYESKPKGAPKPYNKNKKND